MPSTVADVLAGEVAEIFAREYPKVRGFGYPT
jgi:hypothetical protein